MDFPDLDIGTYDEDESLLRAVIDDGQPRLSIYQPSKSAVILGRGSNPERELNLDHCLADRVPLLRRRGGGCAVFIDPGNVIVSIALPAAGINHTHQYFDLLTDWLLDGLEVMGYHGIYRDGISDLVLGHRKIAGSCVYRTKGLLYYSATLLVASDFGKIERYLKHPPREPAYRQGRIHREFLGKLAPNGTIRDTGRLVMELQRTLFLNETIPGFTSSETLHKPSRS